MIQNIIDLKASLDALTQNFSHLSKQLSKANQELQDSLIPPPTELAEQIVTCRKQFEGIRFKVFELAKSLEVSPPIPNEVISARDLETLLQTVAAVEKVVSDKVHQRALEILDRILLIRYSDNIDFPPLQECQAQTRKWYNNLFNLQNVELNREIEALASNEHPLAALLTLISERESPEYQRLANLQTTVAQSFGMPLALAALTGKLIFLSESVPIATDIDHINEVIFSGEKIEPETTSSVEPPLLDIKVLEATKAEISTSVVRTEVVNESVAHAQVELQSETQPGVPDKEQTNAQELAAFILNSTIEENLAALQHLIWQLIYEYKVSLAFHLASCLEIQFPDIQPQLPAWMNASSYARSLCAL